MRPRSGPAGPAVPRPRRSFTAFPELKQAALDGEAPGLAAEAAIGAHRAVAGNDERDRVRAAGAADGAHRGRRADLARDVAVGARLATRNAAQRFPDAALEHRAADVERHASECAFAGDECAHLFSDLWHWLVHQLGGIELFGEE